MAVTAKIYWYGSSQETGLTYDTTLKWDRSLWASKLEEIPWYSKITDVTLTTTFKSSSASGKHKLRLDDSNSGTSVVLSEGGVSKSDTTKTISITSKTSLVTTSGAQAGTINGDIRFNFYYGSIYVPYNYIVSSISICWSITYPTYTINASAGTGGSVSGDIGTVDVPKTSVTKTITATPNNGYKFVKWVDASGNTVSTNNSYDIVIYHKNLSSHTTTVNYTAIFEPNAVTATFKNADGSVVSTKSLNIGATLGTLPTVSRNGYTFAGWIPCAPTIKTDGAVLDSYQYNGSSSFYTLDKKYKYTDKLSVHIEAYASNWDDMASNDAQIISCTESGGWGIGEYAAGAEVYAGGYKGINLGFSSLSDKNWHTFDIVFSNGTFEAYVDGTKKGTQTTNKTAISYNSDNTIFVGAESHKNASTPEGHYFNGFISNVFIANQGTKLQIATTSTVVNSNIDYYPIWRKNTTFTATFKNHDGTVLQTVSVEYGDTPKYTGSTPTKSADIQYTYTFSGWSPSIGAITSDTTYIAQFTATKRNYTINWRNADGSIVSTKTLNGGEKLGTLPTISRSGYTFGGWIPCTPAVKTDNSVLDSYQYSGSTAYPLNTKYKYTDKFAVHIEAYMSNWMDIVNRQIMSCTEGGGWGFGYQANSKVDGAESHGFEVHTGSNYTGYDLKFGTNGIYTNNKWYSFDIVFSNGVIEIFVDGVSKGSRTASGTTVKYNSSNTIFVGGEAKSDTSSAQNYFKGFISNVFIANQGTKIEIATTNTVVDKNIDYYPIWRKNVTLIATFKNHDGSVLQTVNVESGGTPSYTGSTPTKPSTAEYSYSFSGWSPSISAITSDTTYTAQFTATKRKYTINFVNYDNSPLETKEVEYGVTPTYTGATPKKLSDAQYDYVFSTWSPSIIAVTGTATYKAVFNSVFRYYTVSVTDGVIGLVSGNLADGKYSYGSVLKIIANEKVGYKFVNWSGSGTSTEKEILYTVTRNASFIANYRLLQMKFKSVKIYYPTENNIASPTNPLISGEKAQIVVQIALE